MPLLSAYLVDNVHYFIAKALGYQCSHVIGVTWPFEELEDVYTGGFITFLFIVAEKVFFLHFMIIDKSMLHNDLSKKDILNHSYVSLLWEEYGSTRFIIRGFALPYHLYSQGGQLWAQSISSHTSRVDSCLSPGGRQYGASGVWLLFIVFISYYALLFGRLNSAQCMWRGYQTYPQIHEDELFLHTLLLLPSGSTDGYNTIHIQMYKLPMKSTSLET